MEQHGEEGGCEVWIMVSKPQLDSRNDSWFLSAQQSDYSQLLFQHLQLSTSYLFQNT
jgi:hypothetical protein